MTGTLIIVGAGGHGRVAADCAHEMGLWKRIVFLDDHRDVSCHQERWPVIGATNSVFELLEEGDVGFVAIGNGEVRNGWISRLNDAGVKMATLIHPKAYVSQFSNIGAGTIVAAGACVNIGSEIAEGCIVNTGATVDHDCRLGRCVHVCPGANLAGNVIIENLSWIGIGSCIKQGIHIGESVTVGAGSVVISDIEDRQTVVGSPAAPIGERIC